MDSKCRIANRQEGNVPIPKHVHDGFVLNVLNPVFEFGWNAFWTRSPTPATLAWLRGAPYHKAWILKKTYRLSSLSTLSNIVFLFLVNFWNWNNDIIEIKRKCIWWLISLQFFFFLAMIICKQDREHPWTWNGWNAYHFLGVFRTLNSNKHGTGTN